MVFMTAKERLGRLVLAAGFSLGAIVTAGAQTPPAAEPAERRRKKTRPRSIPTRST